MKVTGIQTWCDDPDINTADHESKANNNRTKGSKDKDPPSGWTPVIVRLQRRKLTAKGVVVRHEVND